VLLATRNAAVAWYERLKTSEVLLPFQEPELDIITYLPRSNTMSELDEVSHQILLQASQGPREDQVHVATYLVQADQLKQRGIEMTNDLSAARILRSVLMKPEHEAQVPNLHSNIEDLARRLLS